MKNHESTFIKHVNVDKPRQSIGSTDLPVNAMPQQVRDELSTYLANGRVGEASEILLHLPEDLMPGEEFAVLQNSVSSAQQYLAENPRATRADFQSRFHM